MYLSECISFIRSSVNNKLLTLINKCSYYVNNNTNTISKCLLDKKYIYHKCCNITTQACYCIQNNLFYNETIDNVKYYLIILFISIVMIFFYYTCKSIYTNIHRIESNYPNNYANNNYNYYIIDKNDNLPKYNEIDVEIDEAENNKNQRTIVEIPPPNYIEID